VCSAVLYCAVLYCTVLYCAVLCCTVLYCTVSQYSKSNVLTCHVLYCICWWLQAQDSIHVDVRIREVQFRRRLPKGYTAGVCTTNFVSHYCSVQVSNSVSHY